MKNVFCVHGNPDVIYADNNPFDSFEFRKFAKENDINVVTSSPHFPRSNGRAEKAVSIAKGILKKCKEERSDFRDSLKEYRNTVIPSMGASPAQLLCSRQLKTALPISQKLRKPRVQTGVHQKLKEQRERTEAWYNKNARGNLSELKPGDKVLVKTDKKDDWIPGVVKIKLPQPRSYLVTMPGGELRRTREHLQLDHSQTDHGEDYEYDFNSEPPREEKKSSSNSEQSSKESSKKPADETRESEPEYQLVVPDWLFNKNYVTLKGRTTTIPRRW